MDTILLTGNTDLFSKEVLQDIGDTAQVYMTGRKSDRNSKELPDTIRLLPVAPSESDYRKIFEFGEIRAVWYVTKYADKAGSGSAADESATIDRILQMCSQYGVARMIVLTESGDPADYRKMIRKWESPSNGASPVGTAVVQLPLLSGSGLPGGRLDRIFRAMRRDEIICLEGDGQMQISILSMGELAALLLRMSTENWFRSGIYAADGSFTSLEEFRGTLLSIRPDALIEYAKDSRGSRRGKLQMRLPVTDAGACDGQLGKLCRLLVSGDWSREIAEEYSSLIEASGEAPSIRERASGFLRKFGKLSGTVLDLAIMFILAEYLARFTSESVYFKIVDVRIIYVIVMGMMHGLIAGFTAAALECVMLVIRYSTIGIPGLLLFYNVENWIPFVYYLTAGAISGYSHQKREQEKRSVLKENELIRNKYLFLNEAYRTSVANRKDLWMQILSEKESYSKIYGAVRRMSQRTPEAVCVEAVRVLRKLLDNETVSVYQIGPDGNRAVLLSCCRENSSRQEINMSACREMTAAVRKGETWKNIHFLKNAPMYAAQIKYKRVYRQNSGSAQDITFLVTVERAEQDQLSLWYMNHFTILCGLFQDALENASLRERTLS